MYLLKTNKHEKKGYDEWKTKTKAFEITQGFGVNLSRSHLE